MHYDRRIEQDLLPLTQHITIRATGAVVQTANDLERDGYDAAKAGLIALALAAHQLRENFDLPIEAWAEANRIALSPCSLTNSTEPLPSTNALIADTKRALQSN